MKKTLSLQGTWHFSKVGSDTVMAGIVPGSVLADRLRNGDIEDPFYRDREETAAKLLCSDDYRYMRTFVWDEEKVQGETIWLCCDGIDTLAMIILNGKEIAKTDNMHRLYRFDVTSVVRQGENHIEIVLQSTLPVIEALHAQDPIWGSTDSIPGYSHIRKGHYMYGWDWGPQIPDMGIWQGIRLEQTDCVSLTDVLLLQHHEMNQVRLEVKSAWQRYGNDHAGVEIRVEVRRQGESIVHSLQFFTGDDAIVDVVIPSPELWWPNGYGKQPLYDVIVTASTEGQVRDEIRKTIGLRTVQLRREADQWGESFEFVVNGVPIYIKGANYIPEDLLTGRLHEARTRRLLEAAITANMNCVRVWGGGKYPENEFYAHCDELGLLVWQDFMYACSQYRMTSEFEENVRQEAIDQVKRLRHHASLMLWCGNNEIETAFVNWGLPVTPELEADYLKLYEDILANVVALQDPQHDYWPSSPSSGGNFEDPNAENRGDVHYWAVWHELKPFTEYRQFYFRFCSEFGFQSFPTDKTVATFTEPEDRNIFSYVMERHQKNGTANQKILYYLSQNYPYPKDFSSVLYASQILQAQAITYGVEHWRRHRGRNMGAIYWQLNDCWPVASWSSIDSEGRFKALHYAAKRFYAPLLLSVEETQTTVKPCITNDLTTPVDVKVVWSLRQADMKVLCEGQWVGTAEPLCATWLPILDFSQDFLADQDKRRERYFAYALYHGGVCVSSGTTLFTPAKHFRFLNPTLQALVQDAGDAFLVTVEAQAYARYVEIDLREADAIFSDNVFDIADREPVRLRVEKSSLSTPLTKEAFEKQLTLRSVYDLSH